MGGTINGVTYVSQPGIRTGEGMRIATKLERQKRDHVETDSAVLPKTKFEIHSARRKRVHSPSGELGTLNPAAGFLVNQPTRRGR